MAQSILESIRSGERKSDGEKVSVYDYMDMGLFEYVYWQYDVCALTPKGGRTCSVQQVGKYSPGMRHEQYSHMVVETVGAF